MRAIIDFADQYAYDMQLQGLSLDVAKTNKVALEIYRHLGFVEQYTRPAPHRTVPGYHYLTRSVLDRDEE